MKTVFLHDNIKITILKSSNGFFRWNCVFYLHLWNQVYRKLLIIIVAGVTWKLNSVSLKWVTLQSMYVPYSHFVTNWVLYILKKVTKFLSIISASNMSLYKDFVLKTSVSHTIWSKLHKLFIIYRYTALNKPNNYVLFGINCTISRICHSLHNRF